jgi:hypothetical protein
VKQVDDLNGARKMPVGLIPDPFGAIGYDDFLFRTVPPTIPGFPIKPLSKLAGCLDGAGVGGRIRIADGIALLTGPLGGLSALAFWISSICIADGGSERERAFLRL